MFSEESIMNRKLFKQQEIDQQMKSYIDVVDNCELTSTTLSCPQWSTDLTTQHRAQRSITVPVEYSRPHQMALAIIHLVLHDVINRNDYVPSTNLVTLTRAHQERL